MSWAKIVTFIAAIALIAGGALWAYNFFEAPEHIDTITAKWETAGHADTASRSFTNWDENDPPEVPTACAKCHSMYGYLDFLGADGSPAGQVDAPAHAGSLVYCRTCHNQPAHEMTQVTFPSEMTITEATWAANCMQCHQGREASESVEVALTGLEPDTVHEELGFINVHYTIAAATLLGGDAQVGYQYAGKDYVGRFEHVEDFETCIDCHDAHSTSINPNECSPCHLNVVDRADLREIRESEIDYDGNANVDEPIRDEIRVFHEALYAAIQDYAANVIGQPIVYGMRSPFFFNDVNGNGTADPDELTRDNQYASWTPRLLRAAYNYHYVHQDPGAYAHNADYIFQLLYDSMEDLGQVVPVDLESFVRP